MFWPRAGVPAESQGSVMTQQPILEKERKDDKRRIKNTKKLPFEIISEI